MVSGMVPCGNYGKKLRNNRKDDPDWRAVLKPYACNSIQSHRKSPSPGESSEAPNICSRAWQNHPYRRINCWYAHHQEKWRSCDLEKGRNHLGQVHHCETGRSLRERPVSSFRMFTDSGSITTKIKRTGIDCRNNSCSFIPDSFEGIRAGVPIRVALSRRY